MYHLTLVKKCNIYKLYLKHYKSGSNIIIIADKHAAFMNEKKIVNMHNIPVNPCNVKHTLFILNFHYC